MRKEGETFIYHRGEEESMAGPLAKIDPQDPRNSNRFSGHLRFRTKKTLSSQRILIFFRKPMKNFQDIYMRGEKTEKMKKQNWKKFQFETRFHNEFGSSEHKKLARHMNSRVRFFLLSFTLCKHIFKTSISFVKNKVIIVWDLRGPKIIVFISIRYWY